MTYSVAAPGQRCSHLFPPCAHQALGLAASCFLPPSEEGLSPDPAVCHTGPDQGGPGQLQRVGATDQPCHGVSGSLGLGDLPQLRAELLLRGVALTPCLCLADTSAVGWPPFYALFSPKTNQETRVKPVRSSGGSRSQQALAQESPGRGSGQGWPGPASGSLVSRWEDTPDSSRDHVSRVGRAGGKDPTPPPPPPSPASNPDSDFLAFPLFS